jgi:hypothetical protein
MVWNPLTDSKVGGAMGASVVAVSPDCAVVGDAVVSGLTEVLDPSATVAVTSGP